VTEHYPVFVLVYSNEGLPFDSTRYSNN